jgi:DNA polymerase-3 subunit epsilon
MHRRRRAPIQSIVNRFVAIDVEISSRSPIRICAIGAARFELGEETKSYSSLVAVDGHVRFTHIHGLTAADLSSAPSWPRAWQGVLDVLGDIQEVVAFRASFDRGAILTMSGRHGVRLPRLRFACAAEMMKTRYGSHFSLGAALRHLGIQFPGRPHDPLADARAAGAIAISCRRDPAER